MYPLKVSKNFNSSTLFSLTVKPDGILTILKRRRFALLGGELKILETLWGKLQIFKNNCLQILFFIFLKKPSATPSQWGWLRTTPSGGRG
jgi:hypothetical protein